MNSLFTILIASIFTSNMVLTHYLGLCPFYGVSKKWGGAIGLSLASLILLPLSILLTYALNVLIIQPLQVEYLSLVLLMVSIVLLIQLFTTLSEKLIPTIHAIASPYYPLFSMNALTLGVGLTVLEANFSFVEVLGYALGAPLGFAIVVLIFTSIRERIILHDRVPLPFKGSAIAFIITSFIAMAFMAFTGIL